MLLKQKVRLSKPENGRYKTSTMINQYHKEEQALDFQCIRALGTQNEEFFHTCILE